MAEAEAPENLQAENAYRSAINVALGYVIVAALWILLSDQLLRIPAPGSAWVVGLSIAKGWAFVFVTGALLYALLRHRADRIREAEQAYQAAVERVNQQKRLFFQNTIAAITEGKMLVRDPGALDALPAPAAEGVDVSSARQASEARDLVRRDLLSAGLPIERVDDVIVAVGEAITNAVKHASGGHVSVHVGSCCTWVRVADQGQGIADLMLPRVVLERGYSTKPSLGMGYTLMLALADRLYLSTGPRGTTVVLEICQHGPSPDPIGGRATATLPL